MAILHQFDRHVANMASMMTRFGIDPDTLASGLLGAAMHVCLDCPNGELCEEWLAQRAPPRAPEFCPNAGVFKHAFEIQPRTGPGRTSLDPSRVPFADLWDVPELTCEGSLKPVGWEGRLSDPDQPREICCPICKAKMQPVLDAYAFYEIEEKGDLYWASVPPHLPGERPKDY